MPVPREPGLLAAPAPYTGREWVTGFTTLHGALRYSRAADFLVISGDDLATLLPSEVGLLIDPAEPHGVSVLFRSPSRVPFVRGGGPAPGHGYQHRVGTKMVSSLAPAETLFWTQNIQRALVVLRQSAHPLPFDSDWGTPSRWDQVPGALLLLHSVLKNTTQTRGGPAGESR
ncbi:hypothetical protein [Amycolatopsis japonica]